MWIDTAGGAAYHACLLLAETSCESSNRLLDLNLLVPTLDQRGVSSSVASSDCGTAWAQFCEVSPPGLQILSSRSSNVR